MSRYNLDSRLCNVVNTGGGLESIYGQRLCRDLDLTNVRSMHKTSIGKDESGINTGDTYICAGDEIFKIFGDRQKPYNVGSMSASDKIGNVISKTGPIYWAESQGQNTDHVYLYICDKQNLWRLNMLENYPNLENLSEALPFVNGSKEDRAIPSFISFRGHRLLLTCSNSTQFFFSGLDPDSFGGEGNPLGEMFPGLNFYCTETRADRTVRVIGLDVVYAFGSQTAEVWRDNNDAYDPYSTSINGNYLEGMLFPDAVAVHNNEVYYFDNYRRLCRMAGGRHDVLSDRSMERVWDGKVFFNAFMVYSNGCFMACFQDGEGFTIGYNLKSGSISELSCLKNVKAAQNGILCGKDGKLCEFDDSSYAMHDGEVISKSVQLEVLNSNSRFSLRCVEIDYSIKTVPDSAAINNQAFLFVSPDGLRWSDARILNLNMHENTARAWGFGICHKMQARLLFTNANPVVFNSVTFQTQGGRK
jgi:hypothetical protein